MTDEWDTRRRVEMNNELAVLVGQTIASIEGCTVNSEQVTVRCTDNTAYRFWHQQDCCENVALAEFHGDPADLAGATIHSAEETGEAGPVVDSESYTWTFYRIVTDKGTLVMRWLGESNGYYSESVSFAPLRDSNDTDTDDNDY